jgi:hypothetical protein
VDGLLIKPAKPQSINTNSEFGIAKAKDGKPFGDRIGRIDLGNWYEL